MHNIAKNKHHVGEEVANAVTHGLGALAAVVALVLMLIKATPVLSGVNFAVSRVTAIAFSLPCVAIFLYPQIYPQNNCGLGCIVTNANGFVAYVISCLI